MAPVWSTSTSGATGSHRASLAPRAASKASDHQKGSQGGILSNPVGLYEKMFDFDFSIFPLSPLFISYIDFDGDTWNLI